MGHIGRQCLVNTLKSLYTINMNPPAALTIVVVFGITGDLAQHRLLPALSHLFRERRLPKQLTVLGISRRPWSVRGSSRSILRHVQGDASDPSMYTRLHETINSLNPRAHCRNILYYLAVAPELYPTIATHLHAAKLSYGCAAHGSFCRIVIEKPFGTDLSSARLLNRTLTRCFAENQIYRIDHYLGKETVQNILTFRFANDIFSPLWNRDGIDHVQITAAESIGIENRGAYYDATGALRDFVQNHLLQLLAHIAMEEPRAFASTQVRRERIKILSALKRFSPHDVESSTVRGQYRAGHIGGNVVAGYREEPRVLRGSATETFAALTLYVQNDQWRDVPFYLRTGKRLSGQFDKFTEIAVQFKERSKHLFHGYAGDEPNALFFRIQPDESITIRYTMKEPGLTQKVTSVDTTLCYASAFEARAHDAYERLILDALQGDQTLFTHTDEVEAEWRFVAPILDAWHHAKKPPLAFYNAGSWGPVEAKRLIERDGRAWTPYKPGICMPAS